MDPVARERLLEAVLTQLDDKGREAIDLPALLGAAEVAEDDFEAEYGDLDACLDAAYERLTIQLDAAVQVGCATGGDWRGTEPLEWPTRVLAGLEALLAELAAEPGLARALTRAYPSLGPARQARYQAFVESFAPQLRVRRELGGVVAELPREVESLAVGAAEAIVFEEIASGRTEALPGMAPSILFSVLVPFIGPVEASAEMEKAQEPRN
jgi:AcrR family transcriptional regulator